MENGKIVKSQRYMLDQDSHKITQALLYEQGDVGAEMFFVLSCYNAPIGSEISFECPELGPEPPIMLPPTIVSVGPQFSAGMSSYVPANFAGTIYFSITVKGTLPPDAYMEMRAMYPVSAEAEQA